MNTRLFLTNVNTLFRESAERDRGDMTIQNLAVIVLIAAITASIFATGIPGRVAGGIEEAICRILHLGGLVADCHPAVLPPIAGPSATPRPTTSEPSPGLTTLPTAQPTGQPTQPGPLPQPTPGPSPTGPPSNGAPPPRSPQATPHSEVPTSGCIRGMDRRYLENIFGLSRKIFGVRTSSRGYMMIRQVVGPDGKATWEVSDYTWGEGALLAGGNLGNPDDPASTETQGWLGGMVTNGHSYSFGDEKSARDFYENLAKQRIGGLGVKFTLRTNPLTGGPVWAIGKIPVVGGWFSKFMGSKEPDQPSSSHWTETGVTGGMQVDIKVNAGASLSVPMKGRGWVVDGTRTTDSGPNQGDVTHYHRDRGEVEASLQIGAGDLMRYAPGGKWTSAAALAAIEAITLRLQTHYHQHIVIPPALAALIIKSPDVAINIKRKVGTTDSLTVDKNGYGKSYSRTEDSQWNFYVRVGKSLGGSKGKLSGNVQETLYSTRTITNKTLDLQNPNDYNFFRNWLSSWDDGAFDSYLQQGGGNESQLNFDAGVHSGKIGINKVPALKGLLQFELNTEYETDKLVNARYYKPGTGWVTWQQCLTG
ncbi:MAG: hypothetical protein JWN52_2054 [Actinomycetia bacterium]|nr:hypothetical protein [Actinomycetes bacterium]